MKGKRKIVCKENSTKLLFKNSQKTVNTYSKTYSDASKFCTKSLVMELKRKLTKPKQRYYDHQGTWKRDLSIETDICILRRYYQKNRNRWLNIGAVSVKSKYSMNHTEIDTINEFKRDSSACGDSELTNYLDNRSYNINLTSLVVNNLKKLLNGWIKKYVLENNKTKQKIDSVLDSILHKLDFHTNDTSSCTYTVDVELGDQTSKPNSLATVSHNFKLKPEEGVKKLNRQKISYLTIPLNNKYQQVISTLSIPRKQRNRKNSKPIHKIKKFRYKNILLSISKSSKYLLRSSSFYFLTLPTKSLTKRCATYQSNKSEILNRSNTMFMQKSYNNNNILDNFSISDKTLSPPCVHDTNARQANSKNNTSIFKNMYGISPAHKISNESTNTGTKTCSNITEDQRRSIRVPTPNSIIPQNQEIIDEYEQSDQLVTIDFGKQSSEISKLDIKLQNKLEAKLKTSKIKKNKISNQKMNRVNRKISRSQAYKSIKSNQFTDLFRKSFNKVEKQKELLHRFHSTLKFISNYEWKKDFQINVCPINGNEDNTTTNLKDSNIKDGNIKERDMRKTTPLYSENIISLLDGATSQSKYIVSGETSTDLLKETSEISGSKLCNSKIAQEINELRTIIKSLASTVKELISSHMSNSSYVKNETYGCKIDYPGNINQDAMQKTLIGSVVEKQSKGNQISNNVPKKQILSGLKLRKEPKNKNVTSINSTSYNIIASESLMKVTDMTSAAKNINTYEKIMDEAITCSLPKSKALFEIAVDANNRKLLAFHCDNFVRPDEYICNDGESCNPCFSDHRREPAYSVKPKYVYSKCHQNDCCEKDTCPGGQEYICTDLDDDRPCSVCINMDANTCANKLTVRNRTGLGFCEGFSYCILLWIPILLILWFFYIYVINDLITPKDITSRYRFKEAKYKKLPEINRQPKYDPLRPLHGSVIASLALSDLGF